LRRRGIIPGRGIPKAILPHKTWGLAIFALNETEERSLTGPIPRAALLQADEDYLAEKDMELQCPSTQGSECETPESCSLNVRMVQDSFSHHENSPEDAIAGICDFHCPAITPPFSGKRIVFIRVLQRNRTEDRKIDR
jgi:hypothetical protein